MQNVIEDQMKKQCTSLQIREPITWFNEPITLFNDSGDSELLIQFLHLESQEDGTK